LQKQIQNLGQVVSDGECSIFDLMNTEKIGSSLRVTNAHEFGVTIACCKRDLAAWYNEKGLAASEMKYFFSAYDMRRDDKSLYLSTVSNPVDVFLEIPSRVVFGYGSPVRVLRNVEAFNGPSSRMFPKNTIGKLVDCFIDKENHFLSSAKVEFQLDSLTWTAVIEMMYEDFDSSDLDQSKFPIFFQNFSRRTYIPLSLAYAVTVTSLQGLEFDFLIFDLSDIGDWLKHALYMGITRVRSPSGIWCLNVPDAGMSFNKNDSDTRKHYEKLKEISDKQMVLDEFRKENFVTVDLVQVLENFKVHNDNYSLIC